jgi:hypothetical protein
VPRGSYQLNTYTHHRGGGFVGERSIERSIGQRIKVTSDGCWLYNGKADSYGTTMTTHSRRLTVHRWVYETLMGEIPEGHVLHHTCQNPGCCNPEHLMPLTQGEHASIHAELRRKSA